MEVNKDQINKRVFARLIISYGLILLFAVLMGSASSEIVINAFEKNMVNLMETSILSNIDIIDNNLRQIESTAFSMTQNTVLKPFIKSTSADDFKYAELLNIKNTVSSYNVGNALIKDLYVYNKNADILIDQTTIYSKGVNFYNTKVKIPEMDKSDRLFTETAGYGAQYTCIFDNDAAVIIPFVLPLPITTSVKSGNITIMLDKNTLVSLFADLIEKGGGAINILNENNEILVSGGEDFTDYFDTGNSREGYEKKTVLGSDFYVFNYESISSRWRYIIFLPESYVLGNTKLFRIFSNVINIASLVMGFLMCFYLVYRKTKSYSELLDIMGLSAAQCGFGMKNDEFKILQPHISRLKNENRKIKMDLDEQYIYGREKVLRMLFTGNYAKAEDIEAEAKKNKLALPGSKFGVLLLYCDMKMNSDFIGRNFKDFITTEINSVVKDFVHIYFVDKKCTAILFSFDYDNERFFADVKMYISRMQVESFYKYNIPVSFGVGGIVADKASIADSYRQAEEVIEYSILVNSNDRILYRDLPDKADAYFYPLELEHALFDRIMEGDFENAKSILNRIYEENFIRRKLSVNNINELIGELNSSIKKIGLNHSIEPRLNAGTGSVNKFFEYAADFFYIICSDITYKPKHRGDKVFMEVQSYIKENYANPELSLMYLAEQFNLNHTYLSTLFKKNSGKNFLSYLENLRIEGAVELIGTGKYSIEEVSRMVGYINSGTFRRTFKKHKGISPSFYFHN